MESPAASPDPHFEAADMPMPWLVVEPPNLLHEVADVAALVKLSLEQPEDGRINWLKNMKQLVGVTGAPHGGRRTAEGWMLLYDIKWIQK